MQLFTTETRLEWGSLDLPLMGISTDWDRRALIPPAGFALAADAEKVWFVATRQAPAKMHPGAAPGAFTPELWKHDVAELFIADADGGAYLELNLAANGAWWACQFETARKPSERQPDFAAAIKTYHDDADPASWLAALCMPLDFLREQIRFGLGSRANAAFILNSPAQTFHTAARLPGDAPDFHQPKFFPRLIPRKMTLN
ncbi:hypothetical protein HZ994_00025 [Akkermansiaceae bacterium]|nr:hypothetical protein HZ994_00025 [Akkermansiaceae bacterium]